MKVRHIVSEYTTVIRDAHHTALQNLTDRIGSTGIESHNNYIIDPVDLIAAIDEHLQIHTRKF
jgi:hypothetical protein